MVQYDDGPPPLLIGRQYINSPDRWTRELDPAATKVGRLGCVSSPIPPLIILEPLLTLEGKYGQFSLTNPPGRELPFTPADSV